MVSARPANIFQHAHIATVTAEQMEDGRNGRRESILERIRDEHRRVTSKVPTHHP